MADGKYQLLNHRSKTMVRVKGDYVRKDEYSRFEDRSQLYLYNSEDKKITRLDNFSDVTAALGPQADSVARIMGKPKIRMKNENDLLMLISALNLKK
jgi:CRISPR/Cas system CSM-associated protein Csm5 (group 7 of RAMP superfamily)